MPPGLEGRAKAELERRFGVEICDLDALFIDRMRAQASAAGADWDTVLRADVASPDSPDWQNSRWSALILST